MGNAVSEEQADQMSIPLAVNLLSHNNAVRKTGLRLESTTNRTVIGDGDLVEADSSGPLDQLDR